MHDDGQDLRTFDYNMKIERGKTGGGGARDEDVYSQSLFSNPRNGYAR